MSIPTWDITAPDTLLSESYNSSWPLPEVFNFIPGHLHPGQENLLHDLVVSLPDDATILEIGPYKGRSTCAMGLACTGTTRRIFTIDTFTGTQDDTDVLTAPSYLGIFMGHIDHCGLTPYVNPMIGMSSKYYAKWNKPIDMLFVDGSHVHEIVTTDVEAFWPFIKLGGILAMHDVYSAVCDSLSVGPGKVWCDYSPKLVHKSIFHNLAHGRKISE